MSEQLETIPPLIGKNGVYRVVIRGNSGTGKTTMSDNLAAILGCPVYHLDEIHWKPGWVQASSEEKAGRLKDIIHEAELKNESWVIDGNYEGLTGRLMDEVATDLIWLDPPFYKYFPRVLVRTFRRLFGVDKPCSPGCNESVRGVFFSSDSIILWVLTNHRKARRRYGGRYAESAASHGGKWQRLGDIDEHAGWLAAVSKLVKGT